MWQLDGRSLWFDESVEYLTAYVEWPLLPEAIKVFNYQPPLFSYMLHFWIKVGIEPFWLRMLPLLFTMITLAGIMRWARVLFGQAVVWRVGLVAALLPTELYYAQDLGEYALMICMVTLSLLLLTLAYLSNRWLHWVLVGVFSAAAIYSHYGAAFVVVSAQMVVFVGLLRRNHKAVRRQLMVGIGVIVVLLPLPIYFLSRQLQRTRQLSARPFTLVLSQELGEAVDSFGRIFTFHLAGFDYLKLPRWSSTIILLLLLVLILTTWRKIPTQWLLWLTAAFAVYYVAARYGYYDAGAHRYTLMFVPFLLVAFGLPTPTRWQRWVMLGLLGFTLGLSIYASPNVTLSRLLRGGETWQPREEMLPSMVYWTNKRKIEQPTFVQYTGVPAFRYHAQLLGIDPQRVGDVLVPTCSAETQTPTCAVNNLYYSHWIRGFSEAETRAYIEESLGGFPEEFWILVSHGKREEMITPIADLYEIADEFVAADASATLLRRK